MNQVSSLNLKSESLHLPLANSISSFYSSSYSCNSWISFGRHLLRNYKSYNSATWHKHSPISGNAHITFCTPLYKTGLPVAADKGFRSSINYSETACRTCMYDSSYRRYWKVLKFILYTQNSPIDIWGRCVQKTENSLKFACSSQMVAMTENLCLLHERAPNYLHFIFWSHFSNFDHERVMDRFLHFFSLTLPIFMWSLFVLY